MRANFRTFCRLVGKERVAPVLKSNAYGHGAAEIYRILAPEKPASLCVNYLGEAEELRAWGYTGRLIVVGPVLPEDLDGAAAGRIDLVLGNPEILAAWLARPVRAKAHLKINTGMARQGFEPSELAAVLARLGPVADDVVGMSTHFANVEDVSATSFAEGQLARLSEATRLAAAAGFQLLRHAASSASTLLMQESHLDLCRVGISLYGLWPSSLTRLSAHKSGANPPLALEPVLSWKSRLTTLRQLAAHEYVGYGCSYRAPRSMRLGVVAVGYYEGFPRLAGNQASSHVLVAGARCPIIGRICMNMLMIDVTGLAGLKLGEQVTLIGCDGEERITADDIAGWAQTINYEIVSRLCPGLPRRVYEGEAARPGKKWGS